MVATWRLALLSLALTAGPLQAQSEDELRRHFEGKRVTLKIAMPGTEAGVDVYPGTDRPLDYPRYADRLKDNGTAIAAGDDAMITKIRVKSKHIEFQLDGGGFGTMGDETSTSVHVQSAPKSKREKNLEGELKREKDPVKRREIKEELDDRRNAREREDASNRAEVADAEEEKKRNLRERRAEGGSRFNVRYRDRLPDAVLTPAGLEAALAEWVTFPSLPTNASVPEESPPDLTPQLAGQGNAPAAPRGGLPRKGMMLEGVAELLGEPTRSTERAEGTLRVITRTYGTADGEVTAEFVENVLFRWSVSSR
jgi:hypothetical protein